MMLMTNSESVIATLKAIDNDPAFSIQNDTEIVSRLRSNLPNEDEPLDQHSLAEFYAFTLIENSRRESANWKTYFGSPGIYLRSGEEIDRIPIEKITPDVVNYWKARQVQCKNPLLIARYAGLVWDFSEMVYKSKANYHQVAIPYINSLLETIKMGLITSWSASRIKLQRALQLSISFKNGELKQQSIQAILDFQRLRAKPDGCGTWRLAYDLLVKPGVVAPESKEYNQIIESLEFWFANSLKLEQDKGIDLNSVEAVFIPLMEEYAKTGITIKLDNLLLRLEECFELVFQSCSAGVSMHWLEKLKSYYTQLGRKAGADKIDVRLQQLGPHLIKEMKLIAVERTFSKDAIDNDIESLLSQPTDIIFQLIPKTFIPDTEQVSVQRSERPLGIRDLLNKSNYNSEGRKVSTTGSANQDKEGAALEELKFHLEVSLSMSQFLFQEGKQRNIMTVDAFMQYVKKSNVISANRYHIFEIAFDAWLKGNYIVSIHLMVPQIEAACINLMKYAERSTYKENRYGGYNVKLFGDILRDEIVSKALGNDGTKYFIALFGDPRGYNIRNDVAHGLKDTDEFTEKMANATLIALLHLIDKTST